MAESGFVVLVPEAESLVGQLRLTHDESARLGVPAHVTVLFPFMEPSLVSAEVVQRCSEVVESHTAFPFELARVGRFTATTYLAPHPAAPFVALTKSLVQAFPAYPPFRAEFGSIVPHLTVAHGAAAQAAVVASALSEALQIAGPVISVCAAVVLMENSSGLWRPMHVFPLASSTAS